MRKGSVIALLAVLVFIYTLILMCIGVFGDNLSKVMISYVLLVGKYFFIVAGYLFVIWLPFRIWQQVNRDKVARKEYQEVQKKIEELKKRTEQQKIEDSILNAYENNGDQY